MSELHSIPATRREGSGTGVARAVRRQGQVPGIVYGAGIDPMQISIEDKALDRAYRQRGFFAKLYEIDLGGEKQRVLPRAVQLHPVSDRPLHVDFQRVLPDSTIHVWVPVRFINHDQSPGLKRGATLNIVRHEVELICPPDSIPEQLVVDLAGLNINASVHISHVAVPEGVTTAIKGRDFTLATIAGAGGSDEKDKKGG